MDNSGGQRIIVDNRGEYKTQLSEDSVKKLQTFVQEKEYKKERPSNKGKHIVDYLSINYFVEERGQKVRIKEDALLEGLINDIFKERIEAL